MAVEEGPAVPQIDLDACELDALIGWLLALDDREMRSLAEDSPRKIPHKQWRTRDSLEQALKALWVTEAGHDYLVSAIRATMPKLIDEMRAGGLPTATGLSEDFAPTSLLWYATEAGLDPGEVLAGLPHRAQESFAERQITLQGYAEQLRRLRQAKVEAGEDSRRRAATQEAARMTRGLRWQAEQAQGKLLQSQRATERVAREKADEVRRLEEALTSANERIRDREAEAQDLRQQIADMSRDFAERTAKLSSRLQQHQPEVGPALPLLGHAVLVVGDENRQVSYREIVEELGGEFDFLPGFGNPVELRTKARSATVVAFITAFASHKMWVQARSAEHSGVALVPVSQAGAHSFREALTSWAESRHRGDTTPY